jgi:phosphoserine phosphatase RsbU/P
VLALCSAAMAHAQFVDASAAGEPVKLTAPWRFHAGDDPAWAAPGFDDSQWQLMSPEKDTQQNSHPTDIRYGWYRIRVKLPATQEALALAMGPVACEVYADGRLVGTVGKVRPRPDWEYLDNVNVIPLPQDLNGRSVTLAVRAVWLLGDRGILSQPPFEPSVAPARLQWQQREAASNTLLLQGEPGWMLQGVPGWLYEALALSLGMFSLGLFLLRPRSTEYGWVALAYLLTAISDVVAAYLRFHHAPIGYSSSLVNAILTIILFATAMYVWQFIGARRGGLFWAAMAMIALFTLASQLGIYGLLENPSLGFFVEVEVCFALLQAFVILIFVRLGISARQGDRNAQLLLIPFTLQWSLSLLIQASVNLSLVGVMKPWTLTAMQLGQVTVTWPHITTWLSVASMGIILMLRFTRSAEREQRLSTEMETARRVQAQLVPAELPGTGRFRFEAAYLAAHEVGGDIYQVYPRADGSVMVLVGDVSGKGLKAAMLGTLLVGAANALAKENLTPALMLARLNESLYGHTDGGFATCLCCLVAPNGAATISNAGHLAPYRNGQEAPCSSGLPLGLVPGAEYAGTELQLGESDTLTFLSDGVVEARNAQGELFGFDRTQAISAEPAHKIAAHAVAFGQEDDISVLKLTLAPAGSLA